MRQKKPNHEWKLSINHGIVVKHPIRFRMVLSIQAYLGFAQSPAKNRFFWWFVNINSIYLNWGLVKNVRNSIPMESFIDCVRVNSWWDITRTNKCTTFRWTVTKMIDYRFLFSTFFHRFLAFIKNEYYQVTLIDLCSVWDHLFHFRQIFTPSTVSFFSNTHHAFEAFNNSIEQVDFILLEYLCFLFLGFYLSSALQMLVTKMT